MQKSSLSESCRLVRGIGGILLNSPLSGCHEPDSSGKRELPSQSYGVIASKGHSVRNEEEWYRGNIVIERFRLFAVNKEMETFFVDIAMPLILYF